MDELLQYATTALDQHGHIDVTSARWDDDVLVLRLDVVEDRTEAPGTTTWVLKCDRVREHRLTLGWAEAIEFTSDHVLLWPHVRPWASVYFSGRPADPLELVGLLWVRHRELTAGWTPLERFVNGTVPISTLLDAGFGLLATAPEPLVDEYAKVLEKAGVPWSIAGGHTPTFWNDARGSTVTVGHGDVPRVLTLDESYVVAEHFSAARE